jgi:electron transfer flavoprotein beta subunit
MAAKKKPLEVLSLDDLGVSADPAAAPPHDFSEV